MSSVPYYQDDLVTLYHGDCREVSAWRSGDILVTDPPYGIAWSIGANKTAKSKAHAGILNDTDTTVRDWVLAAWGDRPGIVFGAWAAPFPKYRQVLVWRKPVDAGVVGSVTGYRRDTELIFLTGIWPHRTSSRSSVLETNGGKANYLNGHPHAKPTSLMERLIEWTQGVVVDPTAGSGSTLQAAKMLGRKAIGVEMDERYCEMTARRLAQDSLFGGVA